MIDGEADLETKSTKHDKDQTVKPQREHPSKEHPNKEHPLKPSNLLDFYRKFNLSR